ncbi:MAG: hypothetical protein QOG60_493 [Frankiaceae bacterium]|jgi:hypothetical protein|nr:hypothetical protein [Frankiaceae bacterium]
MDQDQDVLDSLLTGLPEGDKSGLRDAIRGAHSDQLDRKQHPPRRRRRNADGVLVEPPAEAEYDTDAVDEYASDYDDERGAGELTS